MSEKSRRCKVGDGEGKLEEDHVIGILWTIAIARNIPGYPLS